VGCLHGFFGLSPFRLVGWGSLLGLACAVPGLLGLLRASTASVELLGATFGVDAAAEVAGLTAAAWGLVAMDFAVAFHGPLAAAFKRVACTAAIAVFSAALLWSALNHCRQHPRPTNLPSWAHLALSVFASAAHR